MNPGDNLFGDFFSPSVLGVFKGVADKLNTNIFYVIAHSAWESHYGDTHARELHNLFGLTQGGGRNLSFGSYEEGAGMYANILKNTNAFGAKTFDNYTSGLKQAGYNSATKGYYDKVKGMLKDSMKHFQACLESQGRI